MEEEEEAQLDGVFASTKHFRMFFRYVLQKESSLPTISLRCLSFIIYLAQNSVGTSWVLPPPPPPPHPSAKWHWNRFGDVWGLLLTDRQTNKRRWKHHLAGGGNNLFRQMHLVWNSLVVFPDSSKHGRILTVYMASLCLFKLSWHISAHVTVWFLYLMLKSFHTSVSFSSTSCFSCFSFLLHPISSLLWNISHSILSFIGFSSSDTPRPCPPSSASPWSVIL